MIRELEEEYSQRLAEYRKSQLEFHERYNSLLAGEESERDAVEALQKIERELPDPLNRILLSVLAQKHLESVQAESRLLLERYNSIRDVNAAQGHAVRDILNRYKLMSEILRLVSI